jgi:hypothetical protein
LLRATRLDVRTNQPPEGRGILLAEIDRARLAVELESDGLPRTRPNTGAIQVIEQDDLSALSPVAVPDPWRPPLDDFGLYGAKEILR